MDFKSNEYWEDRYCSGGTSGAGSYGEEALFKSTYINNLINELKIKTINDLGCGDSNQIKLINGFENYYGYDASNFIITKNINQKFNSNNYNFFYDIKDLPRQVDLVMSLDVIYHLIEDDVYVKYMINLFGFNSKYVLIYSVNFENDNNYNIHFLPRKFTNWVEKNVFNYQLINTCQYIKKNNGVSFFLYKKI